MTLEKRPPTDLVPVQQPVQERVRQHLVARRVAVVASSRRRAWTAWRVARQLPGTGWWLVVYTPRGAWRLLAAWVRYLRDVDTSELRSHHAGTHETPEYVRASKERAANLRARALGSALLVAPGLVLLLAWLAPAVLAWLAAGVALVAAVKVLPRKEWWEILLPPAAAYGAWWVTPQLAARVPHPPGWLVTLGLALAVVVCGWHGRQLERPLVTLPGPELARVPPLTAPMVTAALLALGSSKMKEPEHIRLLSDPHRRGPGVQIDLELPVPATWVMERREELATALRRELGCVWPAVGPRHPGHLALYVADQPMSQAQQTPWPLLRAGRVDLFRPVPVATDQMGAWIEITLAYCSGVIGAVPRMGKTFMLRELLLIAGLDPRAKVYAFDGKGTGDLSPCGAFAHYVGVGDEPEDIEEQLAVMRGLRKELRRRARVIRELPRDECPESKVTSALADRRDLGLEPIVVGVDETQVWFEYGDKGVREHKAIREEFASITTDLAKRGPALGFIPLLATQQVNANTIPTSISNNAVLRFALKLFGHVANDQVLGTGARKEGIDATMFSFADKGIGYLLADGADPRIVRTVVGLDAVAAEKVAARARALRAAESRLTGQADDVEDAVLVLDEVADCARALAERGRDRAHLAELVEWLIALRPDYDGLDLAELGKRLRNRGVKVGGVKVDGANRNGVLARDLGKQAPGDEGDEVYPDLD